VVIPTALVFMVAGFQVPTIEGRLFEEVGKLGAIEPKHKGPIAVNSGVIELVISISKLVTEAHWFALGVNVYVVIPATAVFTTAGLQVPLIGLVLFEVLGSVGAVAFIQSGPIVLKVGITLGSTVILKVAVVAH
jgi:hypothetical protein